jgi:hypothetical protein
MYFFPGILISLMLCAAVPYYLGGDWKLGTYWVSAAIINLMVTLK